MFLRKGTKRAKTDDAGVDKETRKMRERHGMGNAGKDDAHLERAPVPIFPAMINLRLTNREIAGKTGRKKRDKTGKSARD